MSKTGSCQCGQVSLKIQTQNFVCYICHCTECQAQSASAFAISVPLNPRDVTISGNLSVYKRPAHSGATTSCYFCSECGTRIYHQSSNSPENITVKGGVLDRSETLEPVAHLWTKRKADWIEIPLSVENYLEQPDDLTRWRQSILDSH
jgi:hypothetical protein